MNKQTDTTDTQIYRVNQFTYQLFGVKQLVKGIAQVKRPQLVHYGRILNKVIGVQRSVTILIFGWPCIIV